jgi:apolipoprotein D and lipocalin family protein
MRRTCSWLLFAALCSPLTGCVSTKPPIHTVAHVDLPRYMGDWYVISEIPNFAEKNCFDSLESYALLPDGSIDNWFSCRKKTFDSPMQRVTSARGKVVDPSNATWQLRFYKVFSAKYLVLDLDSDYQWVVVGHPSRRFGWIMARSRTLPEPTYQAILGRLREQGYHTDKFTKVPQREPGGTSSAD